MIRILSTTFIFLALQGVLAQTDAISLKYQFTQGETIRYKTESHDSLVSDMGGQAMTMKYIRHSQHTLQVQKTPAQGAYQILVKLDTLWTDQIGEGPGIPMGGGRERGRGGRNRESRDEILEMDEWGGTLGRNVVASPFILPLPQKPVQVNDTWTFDLVQPLRGRATGENKIKGQCLLYQITQENNRTMAVIIVNTESQSHSEFKGNFNGQDFSMTNQSSGVGTRLVYFDVDKGRITEIIDESSSETASEGSRSGNSTRSSKATIRLLTP